MTLEEKILALLMDMLAVAQNRLGGRCYWRCKKLGALKFISVA